MCSSASRAQVSSPPRSGSMARPAPDRMVDAPRVPRASPHIGCCPPVQQVFAAARAHPCGARGFDDIADDLRRARYRIANEPPVRPARRMARPAAAGDPPGRRVVSLLAAARTAAISGVSLEIPAGTLRHSSARTAPARARSPSSCSGCSRRTPGESRSTASSLDATTATRGSRPSRTSPQQLALVGRHARAEHRVRSRRVRHRSRSRSRGRAAEHNSEPSSKRCRPASRPSSARTARS